MNDIALVSLSIEGLNTARQLQKILLSASLHAHVTTRALNAEPFDCLANLLRMLWCKRRQIVIFAPIGAVVRSLTSVVASKYTDPAIVVADILGRWTVPILSSHEGGANDLAFRIANILGAEPIITTTKEARKDIIVGIGCRQNAPSALIIDAIHKAIELVGVSIAQIRLLASVSSKINERGLIEAANCLCLQLRFISPESIRNSTANFSLSEVATKHLNLPGVAEPSALLAGIRTKLILQRTIISGIAVALAKEESIHSTLTYIPNI
jgi:cobalt-precorrin 5A hydrolase